MRRPYKWHDTAVHIIVLAVSKHDVAYYSLFPGIHFRVVMFSAGDFYLPVRQDDGICAWLLQLSDDSSLKLNSASNASILHQLRNMPRQFSYRV